MQKSSKNTADFKDIENSIQKNVRAVGQILNTLGFSLESYQPHITGERKIKSLTKLVLIGRSPKGLKVVIKTSQIASAKKEISLERKIGQELEKLSQTVPQILLPKEIYFGQKSGFTFFITEYIDQPKIFVAHNLKEQFTMIKKAVESQEMISQQGFHQITGNSSICPIFTEKEYRNELHRQIAFINKNYQSPKLSQTLATAKKTFQEKILLVAKYCGYLIHEDFCPHNFRINNGRLHFLDYTAANFGNKYVTWARLLNYMALHNPRLEKMILHDLKKNRSAEDLECLRILRIYKTIFLIMYYVKISQKTSGNLLKLAKVRINFWHDFLQKLLINKTLDQRVLENYIRQRDKLRSKEEKERQKEFAIA